MAGLFAYRFMVNALQAASIIAVMAGVAGWFMVLRRESFAGHTLSVMAFPGAAAAILIGAPIAAGYYAFTVAGAAAIVGGGSERGRRRRSGASHAQRAAAIGTVQAAALALGFLLLNLYTGILESPSSLLFGSFLGISEGQVLRIGLIALGVLAFFALAGRPLLFASVDETLARAHGVPVRALTIAFMLALGVAVAATAQLTGALLVFALLVAPAATAAQLTARTGAGLLLSVAVALLTVWLALSLSYFTDYAVGFFLTSVAFALYLLARGWRALAGASARRRRQAVGPATPAQSSPASESGL